MSASDDLERREIAFEARIEHSRRVRQFDNAVARYFIEGRSVRDTARLCGVTKKKVEISRAWMGLESGRYTWRRGKFMGAAPITDRHRRELAFAARIEDSRRVRAFDSAVARYFGESRSSSETALLLGVQRKNVVASLARQGLETGRNLWRTGQVTGRLSTRAELERLRGGELVA